MILTTTNARVGKVRREKGNDGHEYIVASFVSMIPGVMNGSRGPLYYPPEEVAANPGAWDGIALCAGHPKGEDGAILSAHDPAVRARWEIGVVQRDTVTQTGNRAGEAWFRADLTRQRAPQVYAALNAALAGKRVAKIEVSTGLGTTDYEDEQTRVDPRTGQAYNRIATQYKPDHLAILTRERGACSVDDGCGVALNRSAPAGNCGCTPAAPARGGVDNAIPPQERIVVPSRREPTLDAPPMPVYGPSIVGVPWSGSLATANAQDDLLPVTNLFGPQDRAELGESDWRDGHPRGPRYGAHPGYETGGHSFDDTNRGTLYRGTPRPVVDPDSDMLIAPPTVEDRRVDAEYEMVQENYRKLGIANSAESDLLIPAACLPRAAR